MFSMASMNDFWHALSAAGVRMPYHLNGSPTFGLGSDCDCDVDGGAGRVSALADLELDAADDAGCEV